MEPGKILRGAIKCRLSHLLLVAEANEMYNHFAKVLSSKYDKCFPLVCKLKKIKVENLYIDEILGDLIRENRKL